MMHAARCPHTSHVCRRCMSCPETIPSSTRDHAPPTSPFAGLRPLLGTTVQPTGQIVFCSFVGGIISAFSRVRPAFTPRPDVVSGHTGVDSSGGHRITVWTTRTCSGTNGFSFKSHFILSGHKPPTSKLIISNSSSKPAAVFGRHPRMILRSPVVNRRNRLIPGFLGNLG